MFGNPAAGRRGAGPSRLRAAVQGRFSFDLGLCDLSDGGIILKWGRKLHFANVDILESACRAKCDQDRRWQVSIASMIYGFRCGWSAAAAGPRVTDDECAALLPQLAPIICAVRGCPAITSADILHRGCPAITLADTVMGPSHKNR